MSTDPRDDGPLRAAVLVMHLAGFAALAAAHLLPLPVALVVGLLTVCASVVAQRGSWRPVVRPLRLLSWTAVGALSLWTTFAGGTAHPAQMLGLIVAAFVAATAVDQDGSARAMLVNVALALAVFALAAGVAPGRALLPPIAVGWLAGLVALVRAHEQRQAGAAAGTALTTAPARRHPGLRLAAGGVAASVVVSLLAFGALELLDRGSSGGGSGGVGAGGLPGGTGSSGGAGATSAAPRSGAAAVGGLGALDLRSRGHLPDTPVLRVPAATPGLWRTALLTRYTGVAWLGNDDDRRFTRYGSGPVDVPVLADDPRVAQQAASSPVQMLQPAGAMVPSPGVLTGVLVPPQMLLIGSGDGSYFTAPDQGRPVRSPMLYTVTWSERASVDALAGTPPATGTPVPARRDPADPSDPRWTQLPDHLPGRVTELGQDLATGAGDRLGAVRAVEDHLRSVARYTLDSPVPAAGHDAVDDFLFVSREGFCEQFAAAEVVLLRASGIPARMAVGWSTSGGPVTTDGAGTRWRTVRESDAHAWVEFWMPGAGWVSSDPTAGAQALPGRGDAAGRVAGWLAAHAWLVVALLVVLVALLALLVTVVLRRRRRAGARAAGRVADHGPAGDLRAAFARFESALAAAGLGRAAGETPAELAARLRRLDAPADLGAALETLERLLYARRPPDDEVLRAASAVFDRQAGTLQEWQASGRPFVARDGPVMG